MVKKCNCKKCVYCKQIFTSTNVSRINCETVGTDIVMPTYCNQYKTERELTIERVVKAAEEEMKQKMLRDTPLEIKENK